MPWCPQCRCEFEEGKKYCSDCGSELVDTLDLNEEEKKHVMLGKPLRKKRGDRANTYKTMFITEVDSKPVDEVFLVNVSSRVQLAYITSMLEQEGIAYRVAEEDIGQYLSIRHGRSYLGKNIYVKKDGYKCALGILKSLKSPVQPEDELNTNDTEPRGKSGYYIAIGLVITGFIIALLFGLVFG